MVELVIVCIVAGLGAGIVTGLAGLSAAVIISPFLVTFLGIKAYDAVGIALASDVLASAFSAFIYYREKNIDIKGSLYMMVSVILATVCGSYIAVHFPQTAMGHLSIYILILMGFKFVIWPSTEESKGFKNRPKWLTNLIAIGSGLWIGLVCGITGAGGGMNMLIALTIFLGYPLKKAVGTSVFIMTFTALIGSGMHFVVSGVASIQALILCVTFTCIGAIFAARYANEANAVRVNRVTGTVMILCGTFMAIVYALT